MGIPKGTLLKDLLHNFGGWELGYRLIYGDLSHRWTVYGLVSLRMASFILGKVYWSECTQGFAHHGAKEKTLCKTIVLIKHINPTFTCIFARYKESVAILEYRTDLISMFVGGGLAASDRKDNASGGTFPFSFPNALLICYFFPNFYY